MLCPLALLTIFRHLTPGGYLELTDICFPVRGACEQCEARLEDSWLRRWCNYMLEGSRKHGSPLDSAENYAQQLKEAGFSNVKVFKYKWPQNSWSSDQEMKLLGKLPCVPLRSFIIRTIHVQFFNERAD
jgi:hypothetical protein